MLVYEYRSDGSRMLIDDTFNVNIGPFEFKDIFLRTPSYLKLSFVNSWVCVMDVTWVAPNGSNEHRVLHHLLYPAMAATAMYTVRFIVLEIMTCRDITRETGFQNVNSIIISRGYRSRNRIPEQNQSKGFH